MILLIGSDEDTRHAAYVLAGMCGDFNPQMCIILSDEPFSNVADYYPYIQCARPPMGEWMEHADAVIRCSGSTMEWLKCRWV